MTVSSNYSSSYSASTMQSVGKRPSFEDMAQELLSSLDSDSDGSVSLDEFSVAMSSSSSGSDTSASSIFSLIDSGGDGSISTEELTAALEASRPKPPEGAPPPPPPQSGDSDESSKLSEIFSALDTNQDGSISQDELMALFEQDDSQSSDEQSAGAQKSASNQANAMLERLISYYSANSLASTDSSLSLSA